MSGLDDLTSESNDRWAEGERRSLGIADYGLGEAVKRYYTLYFPVGLVVLVTVGTAAATLAFGERLENWPGYLGGGLVWEPLSAGWSTTGRRSALLPSLDALAW